MVLSEQVIMWIDKCQQNVERMQKNGLDAEEFRQQYMILSTIVKVAEGRAYFTGTQYVFPSQSK